MQMVVRVLLIAIAALVLAGCDGKDDDAATTTETTAATDPTGTTSSPVLEGAATDPVVVKGTSTEVSLLTDVRAAAHDGYDRIVFQFRERRCPATTCGTWRSRSSPTGPATRSRSPAVRCCS